MKKSLHNAFETGLLCVFVSFGAIAKHYKGFLVGSFIATAILFFGVILPLKDEIAHTRGCLEAVQESLAKTDLELDDKTLELNNFKNYMARNNKEVPRD